MDITNEQFVDICILSGCDYTNEVKINGIAGKTALAKIRKYGDIEHLIETIDNDSKSKHSYDPDLFTYKLARSKFGVRENDELKDNRYSLVKANTDDLKTFLMDKCNYQRKTLAKKMEVFTATKKATSKSKSKSTFDLKNFRKTDIVAPKPKIVLKPKTKLKPKLKIKLKSKNESVVS